MGQYRTYFTKDNTFIKDKHTNTGLNPILELSYGSPDKMFSRVIFSFDVDNIKTKIEDRTIYGNIKHTLNLTSTVSFDKTNLNRLKDFGMDHASSFDLVLFRVPEAWDEGVGYDYDFVPTVVDLGGKVLKTASNYYKRTTTNDWSEAGIYSGSTSPNFQLVATIHCDLGNENIKVEITELVNDLIENGTDNWYGLGLAFSEEFEQLLTPILYSVDYYGKDTHTFFEPFVETTWDNTISDDRNNFYYDKTNKLYLYTNINKNPVNLDEIPTSVTILDFNDEIVQEIMNVAHEGLGVYSVSLDLAATDFDNNSLVNFTDIWKGIKINDRDLPDVEMTFTVKQNNYFNIGNDTFEPSEMSFNFNGIRRGEKITKGEIRKVIIDVKGFFATDELILDDISYMIYVKQGNARIEVVPESKFNKAYQQIYMYLDTTWMISQEYFMDIIVHSNGIKVKKDDINFTILDGLSDNLYGSVLIPL